MSESIDTTPEWATESFIKELLNNYENNNKWSLVGYTIEPAVEKGQNYISDLYRAKIVFNTKSGDDATDTTNEISFIVKYSQEEPLVDEEMEQLNVNQREAQVYDKILTGCHEELACVGETIEFGPKVISIQDKFLVLEDLGARKYKTIDRKKRLNLEESLLVVEKLGKFHAATVVLHSKNPEIFRHHKVGNMTDVITPYHIFYSNAMECCFNFVKSHPDLKQYASKVELFKDEVVERMIKIFTRDENSFNCLNHGDMWINNLMFGKNVAGNDDVIFIDYQEGYFGSPAIDLNFLVYTSCNHDVRDNHLDELYARYHSSLDRTLKKLKYDSKAPSLDDIKEEIRKKFDHALTSLFCITPVQIIENTDYADAANFLADTEEAANIREIVYTNPKYGEILAQALPKIVEQKLL